MTTIKVGMLGLGTVGSGVVERLSRAMVKIERTQGLQLQLVTVAVHHLIAPRRVALPVGTRLTDQIVEVVTDPEIQLVIEVMGTVTTAKRAIIVALTHGKSVITANKDLIATAGQELQALAQQNHCDLFYEASVAGGIPILRTLTDSYASDTIKAVSGILNGTANYILSAMTQDGQPYQEALQAAQRAGYAEADPTNDVGGIDAAYKLIILSQLAFGQNLSLTQVAPQGITTVTAAQCQQAAQSGWAIKLLAQAQRHEETFYGRVAPVAIPVTQPLGRINGVQNGVAIRSQAVGESLYTGPGAGSTATANSVLNDLLVAARRVHEGISGSLQAPLTEQRPFLNLDQVPQAYLLFTSLATTDLHRLITGTNVTLQPLAAGSYRTGLLTATLAQTLRATQTVTLIPITGTVRWPVAAVPVAGNPAQAILEK